MISGIKLPSKPYMKGVTFDEVIADLDLLKERLPEDSYVSLSGVTIKKKTYLGEKYVTSLIDYSEVDMTNYFALTDLYQTISKALPEFITSFPYSETVLLVSFPNFGYPVGQVYERLIDEIQRLTAFLIKNFGIENKTKIVELIKDYVGLCVDY